MGQTSILKRIRVVLGALFFCAVTLLFLDFTGTIHSWLGWTAKVQLFPAIYALNVGVVVVLLLLTLFLGRAYCSVICPLGIMQDIISWFGGLNKKRRYRFGYLSEIKWLRYGLLALFVVACLAGVSSFVALLAPYSSYGRIASNLFAPLYRFANNFLAYIAERVDSYAFYETDVWIKSLPTFVIAIVTFGALFILAWQKGRLYCNTVCPVGTLLGLVSRYSIFRPVIDTSKCNNCGLCGRMCKSSCIDSKNHAIDHSRCVVCMDCLENCKHHAISYKCRLSFGRKATQASANEPIDEKKRMFLTISAITAATSVVSAQEKIVDGGLAVIVDKQAPTRATPILPPGSLSARHFAQHCTGCQLCVSACPNGVLRPQTSLLNIMQPEVSYERGYCRPECTQCSNVCPTGAIRPITREVKSSLQIGYAVWHKKNCIPFTDGVECGNCARHCPSKAILMVPRDPTDPNSLKYPAVNTERCIGCGACENLCPARPFSAIHVEGHLAPNFI